MKNPLRAIGRVIGGGLHRLAAAFSGFERGSVQDWSLRAFGVTGSNEAGEYVTAETALSLSTYFACIRNISEDVGKLPLKVYRRLKPRGKEPDPDHPLFPILHDSPNSEMGAMSFRELLTSWAMGWGDGFARIDFEGGNVSALVPFHPSCVEVYRSPAGALAYRIRYTDSQGQQQVEEYPAWRIFHLHGLGQDGLRGYSIARLAAKSLGLSMAAQSFGAAFFANGSALGGVLEMPGAPMTQEAEGRFRKDWNEKFAGPQNVGKLAILYANAKYNRIGIPPEEAQFIETRQFQGPEVCRWFRMPPHMVQDLVRATFSNIEHQGIEYVVYALMPWLVRWEQEIRRKLLASNADRTGGYFAEHLLQGLMRGDSQQRALFYNQLFQDGVLSPNDIREMESMNPVEGGDSRFIQLNLQRLEDAAAGKTKPALPPPNPPPAGNPPPEAKARLSPAAELMIKAGEMGVKEMGESLQKAEENLAAAGRMAEARRIFSLVFLDAGQRVARFESTAVTKAAEKRASNMSRFAPWADEYFGEEHRRLIGEVFQAPVVSAVEFLGLRMSGDLLEQPSDAYRAEARTAAIQDPVKFGQDTDARAQRLADAIMTEICNGV